MTKARMKIAAGAIACESVLDNDAIERKYIDMVRVQTKLNRRYMKKLSGVLRKLVMK
jgi:hypothetical protein